MKTSLLIIGLVAIGMITGVLLVTRGFEIGNPPQLNYFDQYESLMPGHPLNRLPYLCSIQDTYMPSSEDVSYYCNNPDLRVRYISVSEHNGIINYITFGTRDLRYGDLIAMFGQPTSISRSRNGRIVSVHFDCVYSLVVDKAPPLGYNSRIANVAFSEC